VRQEGRFRSGVREFLTVRLNELEGMRLELGGDSERSEKLLSGGFEDGWNSGLVKPLSAESEEQALRRSADFSMRADTPGSTSTSTSLSTEVRHPLR
jgi:hypothetical protein